MSEVIQREAKGAVIFKICVDDLNKDQIEEFMEKFIKEDKTADLFNNFEKFYIPVRDEKSTLTYFNYETFEKVEI